MHNFARECQNYWRKNFLPHVRYVATIPCESVRHKSNTFHTILVLCTCLYRSHLSKPVSMKQTKHSTQIVRRSKFMFKMSTIHANTYISNNYTPLRNRCRDDGGPTASTPSADVLSTPSHHGSAKTNKHIFEIFSPSGSYTILVFPYQTGWRYSDANPPDGGVEYKGV